MMELMLKNSLTHGLNGLANVDGIRPSQPADIQSHRKFHMKAV